ncbi:MAG: RluA family pseudouridine synthase [Firmicutes bacterium]|nr:RluA family pseudouridine synthase [Bacillota bacterium]
MDSNCLVFHIGDQESGHPVGNLLRHKWGFSRGLVRKLKRKGEVRVNGRPVYMRERVVSGDVLEVTMPPDGATEVEPDDITLEVIYEDEHILAVNKPAGMLVHPVGEEQRGTLANAVLFRWRKQGKTGRFRPVYRLDRDTTGIVLVAGGPYAAQQLARQLENGLLHRRYLAVVEGTPDPAGTIDLPLAPHPGYRSLWRVDPAGKRAVTHYRLIRKLGGAALLSLELETGRTHQIRVHMSHRGHPLAGDIRYGGSGFLLDRQALHAAAIDFRHPFSGAPLKLRSLLPPDMRQLVRRLFSN